MGSIDGKSRAIVVHTDDTHGSGSVSPRTDIKHRSGNVTPRTIAFDNRLTELSTTLQSGVQTRSQSKRSVGRLATPLSRPSADPEARKVIRVASKKLR